MSSVDSFIVQARQALSNQLTVLSFGGGQDSTAILYRLHFDPKFRKMYAPKDLIVVMSDTGDEHQRTYLHVAKIKNWCKKVGIEFYFITADMGYHSPHWRTLRHQFKRNNTIGSVSFPQTCTDNLKVKVIDKFLEDWIVKKYNLKGGGRKKGFYQFHEQYGKVNLLLGFAAKEERRMSGNKHDALWKQRTVLKQYPLIDTEWDRQQCQEYIRHLGFDVPPPSNCKICFYMSLQELLWLYRFERQDYDEWVELEQRKIEKDRNNGRKDSHGVFGKKLIPERLELALEKYGDWSDKQLETYKFSHGHCVMSKY